MKLKSVDLRCPKCKRSPTLHIKTMDGQKLFWFECRDYKAPERNKFSFALGAWLNYLEHIGEFRGYYNIEESK